jgi:hypothetical protein
MKLTGENRRTRGKTCPSATLSTTNPTWTDPGSNPGLRGGRPAANRLSHGTAITLPLLLISSDGILLCYNQSACVANSHSNATISISKWCSSQVTHCKFAGQN